jgi:hypothetical protein
MTRGLLQNLNPDEAVAIQETVLDLRGFESRRPVISRYTFKFVLILKLPLKTESLRNPF